MTISIGGVVYGVGFVTKWVESGNLVFFYSVVISSFHQIDISSNVGGTIYILSRSGRKVLFATIAFSFGTLIGNHELKEI